VLVQQLTELEQTLKLVFDDVSDDDDEVGSETTDVDEPPTQKLSDEEYHAKSRDVILARNSKLKGRAHLWSLLSSAINDGNTSTVLRLLAIECVSCDILGPDGKGLAHVAAMCGNAELIDRLIDSPTIWTACQDGKTPFDYAASNGHLPLVKKLMDRAEIARQTKKTRLLKIVHAVGLARDGGHTEVVDFLCEAEKNIQSELKAKKELKAFRSAVVQNDIAYVERFFAEEHQEISSSDLDDALSDAVKNKHRKMIPVLLASKKRGFSYDTKKAVLVAVQSKDQSTLRNILRSIESRTIRQDTAYKALVRCLEDQNQELADFLVHSKAVEPNLGLGAAATYQNLAILEWLLANRVKNDLGNEDVSHALGLACTTSVGVSLVKFAPCRQVISLLIEHGADVNLADDIWGLFCKELQD
jgi:hypothetical protein